jgi:predicted small secreted protein
MRYAAGAAYLARRRTPWVALVVALLSFLTWGAAPATASGLGADTQALQGFAPVSLDQADRLRRRLRGQRGRVGRRRADD